MPSESPSSRISLDQLTAPSRDGSATKSLLPTADGNRGRGEPHLNSSAWLTPGAVFPAQAGIGPKSEAFAWMPGHAVGLPWLGELGRSRAVGLFPSRPRLLHPAWAKPSFWGCHQPSYPHQSKLEPTVATNLHPPRPSGDENRRGGSASKVPTLLAFEYHAGTQRSGKWLCAGTQGRAAGNA